MPKPNAMLRKISAQADLKYRLEYDQKINMTIQMCADAAFMAAHDVLGLGAGRAERFGQSLTDYITEIAELINSDSGDPDLEYTKAKVDGKLKQICGDNFMPWDERYGGSTNGQAR